jgi:hypothetical protein
VTPDDMRDLYLLRRHCGIGAHEALNVLPAWEVDMLLAGIEAERGQDGE